MYRCECGNTEDFLHKSGQNICRYCQAAVSDVTEAGWRDIEQLSGGTTDADEMERKAAYARLMEV